MAEQPQALIEFPCAYPIKVMGLAGDTFAAEILAVFDEHAPGYDPTLVRIQASSKGTFSSVHVVIEAQGADHIEALFIALKTLPAVRMVL